MHGLPLLQFVAVALLILTNAFFVAAEFALVSIRDTRIEQMLAAGIPGARAVRRLQQDLDDFLPAVQLGVTLCSLALGWLGEPLAVSILLGWLGALHLILSHGLIYAHVVAVTLGFGLITYFHVVVGELVPKSLALRRAEALAVAVAPPMLFFMALARPAVHFLKKSAAVVLRGFDIPMTERASVHSPEELKLIATAARRMGLLPKFQETLIHRALELDEVSIREIMTPRQKIFSLPSNMLLEEASAKVIDHQHSRVPVYDETRGPEHIVGVVYSKDLARLNFFRPARLGAPSIRDLSGEKVGEQHSPTAQASAMKGTGFSMKGTSFSVKGTGFSPYIDPAESTGALQAAEKLDTEGGGGFNPSITPAESTSALAAEGHFPPTRPEIPLFSAASLAPEGGPPVPPHLTRPYPVAPFLELKLSQVMRDVLVVPETKSVLDLIRDFQQRRRHLAIVVDEYGSTVGLVTAEDAIEQLTGELEDEFDSPDSPILTTASGALLLDGGVNLRDLETQMQWRLPRDGGVETLAGFILMQLGHIPKPGESVTWQDRRITVVEMEARRIGKVRVEPVEDKLPPTED